MPFAVAVIAGNFVTASSAWPAVWPKFRMRRGPASFSSAATTAALMRHDSAITSVSTSGFLPKIAVRSRPMRSKSAGLDVMPYLMTSYRPARNSRRGSVASTDGSMTTACGW